MKKILILLAISALSVNAWAVATIKVQIEKGSYTTALASGDSETKRKDGTGTEPTSSGNKNLFEKEGSNLWNVWSAGGKNTIEKSGTLASGYSVYYINGLTYADAVKALDGMSYFSFIRAYDSNRLNEAVPNQNISSQMHYSYNINNDAKTYLQLNSNVTDFDALGGNAAVIFTYVSSDYTVAQYNIIQYTSWDETKATATFIGSPSDWKDFSDPIPEPTSGMLLLLGVAGLALKRKRA